MKKQRIAFTWHLSWHYPLEVIRDLWRQTKFFLQRGWWGYADEDCWSLDYYLCRWLPSALRYYKHGMGFPGFGEANTYKKWGAIVEKMARGFEAKNKQEDLEMQFAKLGKKEYYKRYDVLQKEFEEGMKLFVKWFDHLWD